MARILALLCGFLPLLCRADAALELQLLLDPVESLSGSFEQGLYAEDGDRLETSSGQFSLLQPDNFRWQIDAPEPQLVVVSGGYLWHHDIELETVTRRSVDAGQGYSPLAVLAGDASALQRDYLVERLPDGEGVSVWRLLPRFDGSDFTELVLHLRGNELKQMDVLDPLERLTRIQFSAIQLNPPLQTSDFSFTVPAGADFYQHD